MSITIKTKFDTDGSKFWFAVNEKEENFHRFTPLFSKPYFDFAKNLELEPAKFESLELLKEHLKIWDKSNQKPETVETWQPEK